MSKAPPFRIKTINEFHRLRGLSQPVHPLISVVDYNQVQHTAAHNATSWIFDFYSISLKRNAGAKITYGQQPYDFDEGIMFFMAPGQVLRVEVDHTPANKSGWILLLHPDFLWNTALAKNIRQYAYFDYAVNEALFLSDKEENTINGIIRLIEQELQANTDHFSQDIIVAQVELLLAYSERFYQRQFITRKITGHQVLEQLEQWLSDYFDHGGLAEKGLPTVQQVAAQLNLSPNYLSSLLKSLTGQSTQQHIQNRLIEKARELLSTTQLSVSEIAYALGFEHPQSFSKFFRTKTQLSPQAFRQSFN